MKAPTTIRDLFCLPGFIAKPKLCGFFGDRFARLIVLQRQKKQRFARAVVIGAGATMTGGPASPGIFQWLTGASTSSSSAGGCTALGAVLCS